MRQLYLLRHAKSAWPPHVSDADRPLNERGQAAAPVMAAHLAGLGISPARVLVSPARRTAETAAFFKPLFPNAEFVDEPRIYEASVRDLAAALSDVPAHVGALMMIGHNPGLQLLTMHLADRALSDPAAILRAAGKFPTCAFVDLTIETPDWRLAKGAKGRLNRFITPGDLGQRDED